MKAILTAGLREYEFSLYRGRRRIVFFYVCINAKMTRATMYIIDF